MREDRTNIYFTALEIAKSWANLPNWRFGQLIYNFERAMEEEGRDIFYMEDDELIQHLRECVEQFTS